MFHRANKVEDIILKEHFIRGGIGGYFFISVDGNSGSGHAGELAKHFVTIGADDDNQFINLVSGDEKPSQYPGEDFHRGLKVLGDDFIGAQLVKQLYLLDVSGSHN